MDNILNGLGIVLWLGVTVIYLVIYFSIFQVYFMGSVGDGIFKIIIGCALAALATIGILGDLIASAFKFIASHWVLFLGGFAIIFIFIGLGSSKKAE